jgi:hypothetical protein
VLRNARLRRGGVVFAFNDPKEVDWVQLANRPYGPDATQEERDAIADRVSVIGERLLLMHELIVQTPFSVSLLFDRGLGSVCVRPRSHRRHSARR